MEKKIFLDFEVSKRIIKYEIIAFIVVISVLWIDEVLDIPHYLLGGQLTPINWREAVFETIIIAVIGAVISYVNLQFMTRYFLLKKNEIRTKAREKRLDDMNKTLTVVHHNVNNLANMFQLVCIKAKKSEPIDRELLGKFEKAIFSVKEEMTKLADLEKEAKEDTFEIDF